MALSKAAIVRRWPEPRREDWIAGLSPDQAEELRWSWAFWGRPEQHAPPGQHWRTWLLCAGRGFGKSRAGSEWVHAQALANPGHRIALVGRTAADVRDVMIKGASGLANIGNPKQRPLYEPSKRSLTWPNGSTAICFSAEEPDQLRGPQFHASWCDELAAWQRPDAFEQLQLGLRLGSHPQVVVTTTPRPTKLIRSLLADPSTVVTRGTTFDNADNISIAAIVARFDGTTLGRQELYAEILDDAPGALWRRSWLDDARLTAPPELRRIVVGVDPAASFGESSDETGIVVAGITRKGLYVVTEDRSCRATPADWAKRAVDAYHEHKADVIVAEANNGGDMVVHTIQSVDPHVHVRKIHASRGKQIRAEPVAALFEQKRACILHSLPTLEDQLVTWQPGIDTKSPDRLDAMVHAINELMSSVVVSGFAIPGSASPNEIRSI